MKNVTISMDEELYKATLIEAARAGKSMSRHIADRLREKNALSETSGRNAHLAAIERFLAGPALPISREGKMPSAEERYARGWQRDLR